jgi:ABC-type nitrate/sulfonate/bicarbonate transport system substrate-binding protein
VTNQIAIDEGFYAEEGIDVKVVNTGDFIERLVDFDVDIAQGSTGRLLEQGSKSPGFDSDVLLMAAHSEAADASAAPAESIATTAEFLDARVDLVHGYLAGQLKARKFLHDEANAEKVAEIMEAHGFAAGDPEEVSSISADGSFTAAGMQALVRDEQAQGRLPASFRWHDHFNGEPLHNTKEELGIPPR